MYYKYIDKSVVNHYRLLITSEEIQANKQEYYRKWPSATGWTNLDEKMFEIFPQSRIDREHASNIDKDLKAEFFYKVNEICKNDTCKKYKICQENLQHYYIDKKYHYGKNLEPVIEALKEDIENNGL